MPVLTKNGLDIRGGRFFPPAGLENVHAVERPLLSVPYAHNYTPFTLFGVLGTLHLDERTNLDLGTVNGWDRWVDANYPFSVLTGFNANSRDLKTSITSILLSGPDQLPRFPPAGPPFLPTGVPPGAARPRGPAQPRLRRELAGLPVERGDAHPERSPDRGVRGRPGPRDRHRRAGVEGWPGPSAWHGGAHWFLDNFTPKFPGAWRAEVFRDQNGAAVGVADTFHEMTLGLPYKPRPWLWIRPEARYDRAQSQHPYNDGTRGSQLTLAFDIILQF